MHEMALMRDVLDTVLDQASRSGASRVTAVYLAEASPFIAALTAVQAYNLAGTRAQREAKGPGSFRAAFLDALYRAKPGAIAENPFALI